MQKTSLQIDLPPSGGRIAIDLHLPAAKPKALLFCLAGGGANRRYFNLGDGGDRDFSFAARLAAAGYAVDAAGTPDVGDSLAPGTAAFLSPRDAADALHTALCLLQTRQQALSAVPVIGVGHLAATH